MASRITVQAHERFNECQSNTSIDTIRTTSSASIAGAYAAGVFRLVTGRRTSILVMSSRAQLVGTKRARLAADRDPPADIDINSSNALEHDPEKWIPVFGKIMLQQ
jgi:hypothetical protein